jgi:hypothetical protein
MRRSLIDLFISGLFIFVFTFAVVALFLVLTLTISVAVPLQGLFFTVSIVPVTGHYHAEVILFVR